MIKKLIFGAIAVAVIAAGYIGFTKTNYWERSIRIFSYDKDQVSRRFEGRGGRGDFRAERNFRDEGQRREDFRGRDFRSEIPDSLRRNRGQMIPDSLRRNMAFNPRPENFRGDRSGFRPQDGESRGRDPRSMQKVNLRNVWWFTAVFAAFTAVSIYFDKLVRYVSKNKTNM